MRRSEPRCHDRSDSGQPHPETPGPANGKPLGADRFGRALAEATAGLSLQEGAARLMDAHWRLVTTWQRRVNLTAITDDEEAAWLHYRDSLEALSILPDGPVVDMGSGAGFPGIPIAIADPRRSVTLVEPRRKRASFLETAVSRLRLDNVRVLRARSDDSPDAEYAALVTRATFSSEDDLRSCIRWVAPGGIVIAYRGDLEIVPAGAVAHRYSVRGQARALIVWRRD